MNTPQFHKGQTLTAEALNALAQNQRDLSNKVGRAGLASRYAGPQQLKPVPLATGSPAYLDPLAAPSSVAGVYVRKPWIEDYFATQRSDSLALSSVTRSDGSPLQAGDEIFQRVTVSDSGAYQSAALEVFPASSAPEPTDLWEPGSGSTVNLYRRIGSVIQDPRFATQDAQDNALPFRPLVITHSDASIPMLPRNAAGNDSGVCLLGSLTGATIPVKRLIAGNGVSLIDSASSVTLTATGGGGGGSYTPEIVGMMNTAGSSVLFQDMETAPIKICYIFDVTSGMRFYLTAQNVNGYIQIGTEMSSSSSVN